MRFHLGLTWYKNSKFLAHYLTLVASSFVLSGSLISSFLFPTILALQMFILVTLIWCRCLLSMLLRMPQSWLQNYGLITILHKLKPIRNIYQGICLLVNSNYIFSLTLILSSSELYGNMLCYYLCGVIICFSICNIFFQPI